MKRKKNGVFILSKREAVAANEVMETVKSLKKIEVILKSLYR